MQSIGGYFELELPTRHQTFPGMIALNSGRNALVHVLRNTDFRRIFVPHYLCDTVYKALEGIEIAVARYPIRAGFEPILPDRLEPEDVILHVNYFGIHDSVVTLLEQQLPNLIVDQAQALYAPPRGLAAVYSPRKFIGVPDGGLLATEIPLSTPDERELSANRCGHLLQRIDSGAESGYSDFVEHEQGFNGRPVRWMSELAERILNSVDHNSIMARRRANFKRLHAALHDQNELDLHPGERDVPMVYPFIPSECSVRERLRQHGIYCAQYWPEIQERGDTPSFERDLVDRLVALPIDQRYGPTEMDRIVNIITA